MVLDSSAIIAILLQETDSDRLLTAIEDAGAIRASAATVVESAIVMQARYGDAGERELDLFLHRLKTDIVPVTTEQADIARSAFRRFGKGQHPAGLNYGDCLPYALAASLGESLLFTGTDFARTDLTTAVD